MVKNFFISFVVIFCLAFGVSLLVSFLYNFIAHGEGIIDWEVSFRNGIVLGIIFPLVGVWNRIKKS
ncbi:MAG: hypothetical protein Kow0042_28760 [Calditrichia bacterium]